MSFGPGSSPNDNAGIGDHSTSPKRTAQSYSRQVRGDDGFHTHPIRSPQGWRRRVVIAVVVAAGILAAVFALRATGDRDERLARAECIELYAADVCERLETEATAP